MLQYYSYLRDVLRDNNVKQSKIYNIDETPCALNDIPRYSIWPKDKKEAHVTQPDSRLVLTMLACISANGSYIPPLIIYKGKTIDINYINEDMEIMIASNDNAYTTQEIFRSWVIQFVAKAKPSKEYPAVLIMDNFIGHLDWISFEYLYSNHVIIVGLPEHTSDLTQPLDLSVFGPYKIAYRKNYHKL